MVLFLKNLLFIVVVPGTVAVYLPLYLARDLSAASGFWLVLSPLLLATGAAIALWCIWDFAVTGRGTPAPIDAPKRLVVRGLYRYSRNPMYVGVLTLILGWAARYATPWLLVYALVIAFCFQSFVVFYEEPHLRDVFGDEYRDYCARVGRWLPWRGSGGRATD